MHRARTPHGSPSSGAGGTAAGPGGRLRDPWPHGNKVSVLNQCSASQEFFLVTRVDITVTRRRRAPSRVRRSLVALGGIHRLGRTAGEGGGAQARPVR